MLEKSLRMKRFRPMSKGRAFQIIKPFSRLTLVLEERGHNGTES